MAAQQKPKTKWNRKVLGSVCKGKAGAPGEPNAPDYIKVFGDHVLRDGQFLSLESPAQQLAGAEKATAEGRLHPDILEKIKAKIAKIPAYVRFEIVSLEKAD